jgi:hypothetical protein
MYGNTGTGKTYSMGLLDMVEPSSRGIVPDSIRYIFDLLGTTISIKIENHVNTVSPSLSVKYIWMRFLIFWPSKTRRNWSSEKMQ